MKTPSKKYVVDIWSDYVCPWCWIAKRRFEKALECFPEKDDVQVNVRAYRLAANHAPEPMIPALKRKLGNANSALSMMSTVSKYGEVDGLDYRFDTMMFGDTADAHVLVKAVEDSEVKKRLVEALYEQSTSHGKSLFDRASLAAIAKGAGVSDESIQLAWSSAELRAEMKADEQFAAQLGSGVPLFVFNNAFSVSGAQTDASFLQALNQMAAEAKSLDSSSMGQVCGIDGCKI
ncbi:MULTISPECIES: DsbA family oxidoreductase [Pseudomonas]|uniref:DsbA family oxidoreductase n=2 Tax=Pseudomonas TaxID=286 RepID=A0A9Q2XHH0_9PSED|nr:MULTISPECIES: DsbA family oxidoreductase [Pseudomonas]MBC3410178.1 DsbA family oxidoreductase [Pseudomonas sp. SWRI51]MBV6287101.1 DsbA family oxidoreductase [Pseudomonas aegrilactucae]MDD2076733.1 DsbA family oxidoreductase [Pseudomonas putida]MEC6743548.1 DsbA family oxidoreductase [Pseudomonas qingdaonensis]PPS62428.1 isomerase [Pseudomonas sp. BRM28]